MMKVAERRRMPNVSSEREASGVAKEDEGEVDAEARVEALDGEACTAAGQSRYGRARSVREREGGTKNECRRASGAATAVAKEAPTACILAFCRSSPLWAAKISARCPADRRWKRR